MRTVRMLPVAVMACAALMLCAAVAEGLVPLKMNYQVMLTDNADQPLADQTVDVDFRIYGVASGGPVLWAESQSVTTNSVGVATVVLGSINPLSIDFDVPLWLEVQVEDQILSPRRELMASPYALHARRATYALTSGPVDSTLYAENAAYADTAGYALAAAGMDTALYAHDAGYADTAGYALAAAGTDTALYAQNAGYADTAGYALATAPTDTALYAHDAGYADTAGYAAAAGSAGTAATAASAADADSLGGVAAADYALSTDIPEEPGLACFYSGAGTQVPPSYDNITQHSITVPAAGYVYVSASAQANCTHDTTAASELLYGVSADSTTLAEGHDLSIQIEEAVPTAEYRWGISPSTVFQVGSAGTYTFYLNCAAFGTWYVYDSSMTLLYFPTAYGSVTGAVKAMPDDPSGAAAYLSREPETWSDARVERELADLESRIEEIRALTESGGRR